MRESPGANLRYALSLWAARQWGTGFPYDTLLINVLGSFLIGLVLVLATTTSASSGSSPTAMSSGARPGALRSLTDWFGGGRRPEGLEVAARDRIAADVMTSPVVTVTPDSPIVEAIRLMMAQHIKRLPVVDAAGRLVGLVGRAGVLAAVSHAAEGQR